jgi:Rieske Fe-S protein
MTHAPDVSRRTLILVGGAGAAVALTGCGAQTRSTGDSGSKTSTGAGGGKPVEVARLADIPVGGSVSAVLDGKPIVVAQPTAGHVVAFSAVCTHMGCPVAPGKGEFDCPCHGSRYDLATGAVLAGPAPLPLAKAQVTLAGDSVLAG